MFHYIKGPLTLLGPSYAVVEAGGVGFHLTVSANTYNAISPAAAKNETVQLFTYLAVREDAIELFGFATKAELDMYELLVTVSGVGPKVAIAILSSFTPEKFALAVCTDDRKTIARANGVGPKLAARIILELRDKMMAADDFPAPDTAASASPSAPAARGGKLGEAQEALLVLGYSRSEVLNVLHTIDASSMEVEDIIRTALKKLMK